MNDDSIRSQADVRVTTRYPPILQDEVGAWIPAEKDSRWSQVDAATRVRPRLNDQSRDSALAFPGDGLCEDAAPDVCSDGLEDALLSDAASGTTWMRRDTGS